MEETFNNKPLVFEVYAKVINSIERNMDRRYQTNRFYLSVLVALGAAFGLLQGLALPADSSVGLYGHTVILVASATISLVWVFHIIRFREIARIKHEVALSLEEQMGVSGLSKEQEIEAATRTTIPFTYLELFLPVVALTSSILFLLV